MAFLKFIFPFECSEIIYKRAKPLFRLWIYELIPEVYVGHYFKYLVLKSPDLNLNVLIFLVLCTKKATRTKISFQNKNAS